jgi:hypothetical protein
LTGKKGRVSSSRGIEVAPSFNAAKIGRSAIGA